MKILILYENNEVVVVNKPAGLLTHNDKKDKNKTLANWALECYPEIKNVGDPSLCRSNKIARSGIVHRLDRETSGVIVLAKTQESFLNLKKQFQERKVTKIYNAFVCGEIKKEKDIINRPIGKSKSDFRKWSAQRGARGDLRDAVTYYKVLKKNKNFSYVEVSPKTGRTHQIRVHFKAINHPVVCDNLYAPKHICGLGFERLALHSKSLKFSLINGETVLVESELPKDFKYALTLLV